MDDPYAVDRRGFLKTGAAAAAATAVACGAPKRRWRALSEEEAATLAAACDRIIPPDQDPGAAQAGVVTFIDRQLATRQKERPRRLAAGDPRGLDATARRRHGKPFAELGVGRAGRAAAGRSKRARATRPTGATSTRATSSQRCGATR